MTKDSELKNNQDKELELLDYKMKMNKKEHLREIKIRSRAAQITVNET